MTFYCWGRIAMEQSNDRINTSETQKEFLVQKLKTGILRHLQSGEPLTEQQFLTIINMKKKSQE